MSNTHFARLVRLAEGVFGRRKPGDASRGWPDGGLLGLNKDNIVEFPTRDYETFARWFEHNDDLELLVVIINVHPTTNFEDFMDEVQLALPNGFEIENPEREVGTPICLAYTMRAGQVPLDDQLELSLHQLRAVADHVASKVRVS